MKSNPIRRVWNHMLQRCRDAKHHAFGHYGGRGITVCERWQVFENFAADMGPRPAGGTLERRNNDGNYEPSNCYWADRRTQSRNRGYVRELTFNGKTQILSDWARDLGVRPSTLSMRLDKLGWTVERALSTPAQPQRHFNRAQSGARR